MHTLSTVFISTCLFIIAITTTNAVSFEDTLKYTSNDYYGALELTTENGFPADTTTIEIRQIKKAFRKLSLVYHPDKTKLPAEEAKQKFEDISNAYEILKDDGKRKEYDDFIKSLPKRFRPEYGKTLFKPSVIGVISSFVIAMFIFVSVLQYNSFQLQKKRIMATAQYKNDLLQIRSGNDITIEDWHNQIFKGKNGWQDTMILAIPISIYHLIICKPCREHEKNRKVQEKLREIDMQLRKKEEEEEAKRKKLRNDKRSELQKIDMEREEREQEAKQKEKRIAFVKTYFNELKENKVFEDIENTLEERGMYTGRTLKQLVKMIQDDNDVEDFNIMLDVYIEAYEQDAEEERLMEEERQILLQEEEERKQRESLLNNFPEDSTVADGDIVVEKEDADEEEDAEAEAKRNEEWIKEMEAEKKLKMKQKNSKKNKKKNKKVVSKEKKGRNK